MMNKHNSVEYDYNSRTKRFIFNFNDNVVDSIKKALTTILGKSTANLILIKERKDSFELHSFFLLELHYVFKTILENEHTLGLPIGGGVILDLIYILENDTWLAGRQINSKKMFNINELKNSMKFMPLEHQLPMFYKYEDVKNLAGMSGALLQGAAGSGKALKHGTPVLTNSGWVNVENLKLSHKVIGSNGLPIKINGIYPQGVRELIRLEFSDGRHIDVDKDHLWKVRFNKRYSVNKTTDIVKQLDKGIIPSIPVLNPNSNESNKRFKIHPYILGILLNDTSFKQSCSFTTNKKDVVNKVKKLLPKKHILNIINREHGYITYDIVSTSGINIIKEELKDVKLNKTMVVEKFIPSKYIDADYTSKVELIRGLLTNTESKEIYETTGSRLSNDIQNILWSLGCVVRKENLVPRYMINGVSVPSINVVFRLVIESNNKEFGIYKKDISLDIVGYFKIPSDEATCIAVDSSDKLFVTKDYLLTHNTYVSLALTELLGYNTIIIIAPKNTLEEVWVKSVSDLFIRKQSHVVLGSGFNNIYNNEKFIITNYEYLDKLLKDKKLLRRLKKLEPALILDESHNLNDIKSKRTNLILDFKKAVKFKDILLLSGTPIKYKLSEIKFMLHILDDKFSKVEDMFDNFYKSLNYTKVDLIKLRFNLYNERVENTDPSMPDIEIKEHFIKVKNGKDYTLETIEKRMTDYKVKRLLELNKDMDLYRNEFDTVLESVRTTIKSSKVFAGELALLNRYLSLVKLIRTKSDNNKLFEVYDEVNESSRIEKEIIIPKLDSLTKVKFRHVKSIVKYPKLKVLGEALGKILLGTRIKAYKDLASNIDYYSLFNLTNKKALVFSNYIGVCDVVVNETKEIGYNPIPVYGEHIVNLTGNVKSFNDLKTDINPIVATYKSLSTGVPLTSANVIVLVDTPQRDYILNQALSRSYRLGNLHKVSVFMIKLDTGADYNITDRDLFIVNTSAYNVERITGVQPTFDIPQQELYSDNEVIPDEITEELEEEVIVSFNNSNDFIDKDIYSYVKNFFKKIKVT